ATRRASGGAATTSTTRAEGEPAGRRTDANLDVEAVDDGGASPCPAGAQSVPPGSPIRVHGRCGAGNRAGGAPQGPRGRARRRRLAAPCGFSRLRDDGAADGRFRRSAGCTLLVSGVTVDGDGPDVSAYERLSSGAVAEADFRPRKEQRSAARLLEDLASVFDP